MLEDLSVKMAMQNNLDIKSSEAGLLVRFQARALYLSGQYKNFVKPGKLVFCN